MKHRNPFTEKQWWTLSLPTRQRWWDETDFSKRPEDASQELLDAIKIELESVNGALYIEPVSSLNPPKPI